MPQVDNHYHRCSCSFLATAQMIEDFSTDGFECSSKEQLKRSQKVLASWLQHVFSKWPQIWSSLGALFVFILFSRSSTRFT